MMKGLADDYIVACKSKDPLKDYLYTPAIIVLDSGRYIMSLDVTDKYGKIYSSDDKGETWQLKKEAVFAHASLFKEGRYHKLRT